MALTFAKKELEVECREKGKKPVYFNAFLMPYEMKRTGEEDKDFLFQEEQFNKAVEEFLSWH